MGARLFFCKKAGLSEDLKQNTELSAKDYNAETAKDGHNGRKLEVTLDTTGNTVVTEAIPPETTMPLVVNKDQTGKLTDVTAANQGSDPATKVRFKAAEGAAIKIYKADDQAKTNLIDGKPVKGIGDNEGYFIATLNAKLSEGTWIEIPVKDKLPLNDRDQIKVTFKDGEDPANEAFDRRAVQKASQKPIVDQVYTGDDKIKIADPTRADETATTIKVKVNANDSMTIEKQVDDAWKIKEKPGTKVEVEDGKVVVPLDPKAVKGDTIEVKTINDSKVESAPAKVEVEDKVLTTKSIIKEATKDTNFVTRTAEKNADIVVKVTKKDGTSSEFRGKAGADRSFKVTADTLVDGDKVVVTASEPGKADNTSDEKTVGVDTSKLRDSITKADKVIKEDGTTLSLMTAIPSTKH